MPRQGKPPELAIPVASLAALRRALATEVGPDGAARALAAAGHAAGDALFTQLSGPAEVDAEAGINGMSEATFWRRLGHLFASRGWGTLAHSQIHEGVGALDAADWVEADRDAGVARPSCFFTTGMLANVLGNVAGAPVAVLEVECRSRGDARCRFLFGSNEALHALYQSVGSGASVDTALAELSQVGRILGIDYGERRVGLAISDPSATIAQPLPTLIRRAGKRPPVGKIVEIITANEVEAVVVGLPLTLAGDESDWTSTVRSFGEALQKRAEIPVHFLDERLTSVQAERSVRELGLKKSQREQKERIDAAAAMILLQRYLDRT